MTERSLRPARQAGPHWMPTWYFRASGNSRRCTILSKGDLELCTEHLGSLVSLVIASLGIKVITRSLLLS